MTNVMLFRPEFLWLPQFSIPSRGRIDFNSQSMRVPLSGGFLSYWLSIDTQFEKRMGAIAIFAHCNSKLEFFGALSRFFYCTRWLWCGMVIMVPSFFTNDSTFPHSLRSVACRTFLVVSMKVQIFPALRSYKKVVHPGKRVKPLRYKYQTGVCSICPWIFSEFELAGGLKKRSLTCSRIIL